MNEQTHFTIVTPLHKPYELYIRDCYNSLVAQTSADWEWIVVLNNGGSLPDDIQEDDRVRPMAVSDDTEGPNSIGRLKSAGFSEAKGNILVELDADDLLLPECLAELTKAFSDSTTAMVYSNSASFDKDWKSTAVYSNYYGWKQRPFFWEGHELVEMIGFPCNAEMMRRIEWAPNHVRAWRRSAYEKVGGHNIDLKVGDDHDICCRFFIEYGPAAIKHIDKCLYLYRTHDNNTSGPNVDNDAVQDQVRKNYLKYSRQLAIRQATDDGLALLDLGGRLNAWPGFTTVDLLDTDVITDLNGPWSFEDNSVGVIRASHVFEHLIDPVHTMNEAYRVLAPGGWIFIDVPSTDGRGAFQDPTHKSFWNSNSFWYYTDKQYAKYIPEYKGRFQLSNIVNWYPTKFEELHNIVITQADLIALKGQRQAGEMRI